MINGRSTGSPPTVAEIVTVTQQEMELCLEMAHNYGQDITRERRRMLELLAGVPLPWADVHVFQVDERIAPHGDRARNANAAPTVRRRESRCNSPRSLSSILSSAFGLPIVLIMALDTQTARKPRTLIARSCDSDH